MRTWKIPQVYDLSVASTFQNPGEPCESPNPGGVCHDKANGQSCPCWRAKNEGNGVAGNCICGRS